MLAHERNPEHGGGCEHAVYALANALHQMYGIPVMVHMPDDGRGVFWKRRQGYEFGIVAVVPLPDGTFLRGYGQVSDLALAVVWAECQQLMDMFVREWRCRIAELN